MIKSLSPYYITIPFVAPLSGLTCTSFTLKLYVWNGDKGTPPTEPTFIQTKENPTSSTSSVKINVARLISDFIDFTPNISTTTENVNGENQYWLKWETTYITADEVDSLIPSNKNTVLYSKGYSYGLDGENVNIPYDTILIPKIDYKVSPSGTFIVPILTNETTSSLGTLTIDDITLISGEDYNLEFSETGVLDDKYVEYKLDIDSVWTGAINVIISSPDTIQLPTIPGDYNIRMYAYDNVNAVTVYSNIFDITIV